MHSTFLKLNLPVYVNPACVGTVTIRPKPFVSATKVGNEYIPIDFNNYYEYNNQDESIIRCYLENDGKYIRAIDMKNGIDIMPMECSLYVSFDHTDQTLSTTDKNDIICLINDCIERANTILNNIKNYDIGNNLNLKAKHQLLTSNRTFMNAGKRTCSATNLIFNIFQSEESFKEAKQYIKKAGYYIDELLEINQYKNLIDRLINGENTTKYDIYYLKEIQHIISIYSLSVFVTDLTAYIDSLKEWKNMMIQENNDHHMIRFKTHCDAINSIINDTDTTKSFDLIYKFQTTNGNAYVRKECDYYIANEIWLCRSRSDKKWNIIYGHNDNKLQIPNHGLNNKMKYINDYCKFCYEEYKISDKIYEQYIHIPKQ